VDSHVFLSTSPSTRLPQASSAPAARYALHWPRGHHDGFACLSVRLVPFSVDPSASGHHDGFACSPFVLEVALAIDELRLILCSLSFLEVALAIDELRLLVYSHSFL